MKTGLINEDYLFLQGGGEMGALTREYDWSQTSLGIPSTWPQSLRTSMALMLSSTFPMVLFWGEECIQFYNDAFHNSLDFETGQALTLGQSGVENRSEKWKFIYTLVAKVRASKEACLHEKQQIAIYRNGKLVDTYWTFSFSPLTGERSKADGVLLVCQETTKANLILEKERTLQNIILQAPVAMAVFKGRDYVVEIANKRMLELWGKTSEELLNMPLFEGLPEAKGQGFESLLDTVYTTGNPFSALEMPARLTRNGQVEQIYLNFVYEPYRDVDGTISGIFCIATEVTEQVVARLKIEESEHRFVEMIQSSPSLIAILEGKEMILTMANDSILKQLGKGKDIIGKPYLESNPELEEQGIGQLLRDVYETGIPHQTLEAPVFMVRDGKRELSYYHYLIQPRRKKDGEIEGLAIIASEVTSQGEINKKLKESEERFRNLVLQAPVAICVLRNENYLIEVINESMCDMWDRTYDNVIGKPAFEILPELLEQGFKNILDLVYTSGERFVADELPISLRRNGALESAFVKFVYEPMRDGDGQVTGVMALAHEITEQVVARKIVEEREHKFRTLIEESSVASGYYLGPDIKVQYANDIMLGYFGKGKSILGKPMREVLPEIESQPFLGLLNAVYTTGEPYIGVEEKADLIVDGKLQTFYFNYTYKALRNIDNQIYGIHHIAFDVTSQVMAKRALVEIEKNLRNTILHAPVAMCIYRGPTFVVEVANNRMLELWGKTAEAVIDKPMFVGLPEAKDQGFEELIEKVYKTGVSYSASNVPVTLPRNGSIEVVYVNFIYQAYREVDGAISGIIAVATDVTEQYIARQQIEEKVTERTQELAITNHNLQKSNAELAQFAYIASHDLQEPIRKIANFSYMLEQSLGDIDLKSKNYLEKINTSTSRMLNLIRDVLSYSQLSKEGSVFEKVDLNIIIEHIKSDFDLMIEQKEAVVECSALPIVDAIPLQMTQLFSNLLSNALKFINSEVKPIITITASVLSKEEIGLNKLLNLNTVYHKIEFRDNGIGIEEKHAKKIFNIFQRLHVQADYKGTGIGLAMCKKIAQNHHGDIYITSSSFKKETIFSVILPETINVLN